jgi:hypothetical protein
MKDEYDFSNAKRGAVVPLPVHQTEVRLRLDSDILDWLRDRVNEAGGGDYQSTINTIIRSHIETQANEVPVVAKKARIVEEVVVGKTAPERSEAFHFQGRK